MTKEQHNIITLYGLFIISVICNFIPSVTIQTIGLIVFFICFVSIYILRHTSKKASLTYSHSCYIIKSIWIFSLFFIIGSVAAGLLGDHSTIEQAVHSIQNGFILTEEQLHNIIITYGKENFGVFLITMLPSILYFLYRLIKGVKIIISNTLITHPKNWF